MAKNQRTAASTHLCFTWRDLRLCTCSMIVHFRKIHKQDIDYGFMTASKE
jgi:hypothetical protein